jgi:ATP-dependent Clp protease ATP-binding subunit ClpB
MALESPVPATITLSRYEAEAKALIASAQNLADENKHREVLPLHLLSRALERMVGVAELFQAAGVDVVELGARVSRALGTVPASNEPAYLSTSMLELLKRAEQRADLARVERVGLEQVVHALTQEVRGPVGDLLTAFGVFPGSLEPHYGRLRRATRSNGEARCAGDGSASDGLLEWVDKARKGQLEPTVGRESELRRLLTVLERRYKCHALLVGEVGVGKTALVRALARKVADGDVPTSLSGVKLYELEPSVLLAGAKLRAEVEDRLRKVLSTLSGAHESILFIRGLEQFLGQGSSSSGLLEPLKGALTRGQFRLLATTTPDGMRRISEKEPELFRYFSVLTLEEASLAFSVEILRGLSGRFEAHHQIAIENSALTTAVELGKRYLQDRFLPDSAIDLLDESAASLRVETDGLSSEKDGVIQRYQSLRVQIESLSLVSDADSLAVKQRLTLEKEQLEPQVENYRSERESRRGVVAAVRQLRAELEQAKSEMAAVKAAKNFARLGELEHSVLPALEERLMKAERAAGGDAVTRAMPVLRAEQVAATLAAWTGIPVQKMLEGEAQKLVHMADRLEERVVGQPEATNAIARAVKRGRVGLRDQKRPIGSFLFLGPSGVGKTELAKAVAEFLFDDEQALTRLDMSEFMERHMAQRLVGAPPGYADSEQGGFLTEAVRKRPYSVLLFDEVEKAHADVFNLLLQVLDDGRLTDGRGKLADFSNTVVVMTSNIGSQSILGTELTEFDSEAGRERIKGTLLEELRRFFRPELLNRIDEVVVFRPLSREVLKKILRIQLKGLKKLLEPRGLSLEVTEAAENKLVELGYEPAFGARPLRRVVAKELQDPLADKLLGVTNASGATLTVDLDVNNEIAFNIPST